MSFSQSGLLIVEAGARIRKPASPTAGGKRAYHSARDGALFAQRPSSAEINQGGLGNCWVLASVNAVVTRAAGPDLIMNAMCKEGNGHVVVRLHHDGGWNYYRVEKSVRWHVGRRQHSMGALWVNMLEKALVMICSKQDYELESGGQSGPGMSLLLSPA